MAIVGVDRPIKGGKKAKCVGPRCGKVIHLSPAGVVKLAEYPTAMVLCAGCVQGMMDAGAEVGDLQILGDV